MIYIYLFKFFVICYLALYYVNVDGKVSLKKLKKCFFALKKLKKPNRKVAYLWQLEVFFLGSPDCPKQPRTSFLFYKSFYPIASA